MNNDTFILVTQFLQKCRKCLSVVDSKKFINDESYRKHLIGQLQESEQADIELILQAQSLNQKLVH